MDQYIRRMERYMYIRRTGWYVLLTLLSQGLFVSQIETARLLLRARIKIRLMVRIFLLSLTVLSTKRSDFFRSLYATIRSAKVHTFNRSEIEEMQGKVGQAKKTMAA